MRRSTIQQNWVWGLLLAGAVSMAWAGKVSDMEFVETEAIKAAEIEFKKWTDEVAEHLMVHDQPIVRILGTGILWHEMTRPAGMTDQDAASKYTEVRRQALEDGWSDPAVLAHIYSRDCHGKAPVSWCEPAALQAQFQRVDPDNALGPLMALIWPSPSLREPDLTMEIEAQLVAAAQKKRFDIFHGAGGYDVYLAMKQFKSVHSTPEWPEDALVQFEQAGFEPWEGMELNFASLPFLMEGPDFHTNWSTLFHVCDQAKEREREEATRACRDIGALMRKESRSEIGRSIGNALLGRMTSSTAESPELAPGQPAQVYERVEVQLRACRLPRLMGLDLAKMPADHWPQLLKDQQEAGEVAAMQRAAQREYALYPELFAWDPADCDSIYELDEAERKALAVEMQELQHARARKVQESVNPVR